jgi:hypothetical protein
MTIGIVAGILVERYFKVFSKVETFIKKHISK